MRENLKYKRIWGIALLVLALVACRAFSPRRTSPSHSPLLTPVTVLPQDTEIESNPTASPSLSAQMGTAVQDSPAPGVTATTPPTASPTFSPTSTPIPALRFAVIGDYGLAGPAEAAVAKMVLGWQPELILTTGDNNYPRGAADTIDENIGQYFHAYIYPYLGIYGAGAETNRFFPTLGNHDWDTLGAQPYLEYFSLPGNERYYDFMWGPVHFFSIDSDTREPDRVGRSSDQAAWLKETLANSSATWNLIYTHYPPYSSAYHGSTDWIQWPFAAWDADVVLAGHDHTYERLEVDGLPYFVNGLGGGAIYAFKDPHPGSLMRYNKSHGALWVEATANDITFRFYAVPDILIDTFTLNR